MPETKCLNRREIADRYGISRVTTYGWVETGILPQADIVVKAKSPRNNRSNWSRSLLARWEKANAPMLQRMGVDVGRLPPLSPETAPRRPGRASRSAKAGGNGRRRPIQGPSPDPTLIHYAHAILLFTQSATHIAKAAANGRLLSKHELRKVLRAMERVRSLLQLPER